MAVSFLLDEHFRGPLWRAILRHNTMSGLPLNVLRIDVLRIGDDADIPLGLLDPQILDWCERNSRLLVTADKKTMVRHVQEHLAKDHHTPGVIIVVPGVTPKQIVDFLCLANYASDPSEWRDVVYYLRPSPEG